MLENLASWYRRKFNIIEIRATLPFAAVFFAMSFISGWISLRLFLEDPAELDILLWSLVPMLFFGGWVSPPFGAVPSWPAATLDCRGFWRA